MVNADLWRRLDEHLSARPLGSVHFLKVKGHSSTEDVLQGRTTDFDKFGNDAADQLAVGGACTHSARNAQTRLAKRPPQITLRLQRMMLEIAGARARYLRSRQAVIDLVTDSESECNCNSDLDESRSDIAEMPPD